ncbi:MAG: response regulator [Oscillospiraceae bacterium]
MEEIITVMIVDDEYIVREDLKSLIPWEESGFHIIGEANNGEQGLQLFKKYRPDLIIADIKMPIKDGLQMAQEIKSSGAFSEWILLTAYDEFNFARKAMNMGISHYLLKDEMDTAVLLQLLNEIRPKILLHLQSEHNALGNEIREILIGSRDQDNLSVSVTAKQYTFLLLNANMQTVMEVTAQKATALQVIPVMQSERFCVLLLEYSQFSELLYHSETAKFGKNLSAQLGTTVALSERVGHGKEIREVYRRVCRSFENAVFLETVPGVLFPEAPVNSEIDRHDLSSLLFLLRETLRKKAYAEFLIQVKAYVIAECLKKYRGAQFLYAKPFLIDILENHNENYCLVDEKEFELLHHREDTVYIFLQKITTLIEKMQAMENHELSKNMRKVIFFIQEHFSEDLTLDAIAQVLSMNTMYAGQLFKKEVGISFKQYLCEVRISRAKDLLQTGEYKIHEVSNMVGYQTTQYFCNIFKKVTGISPSEYGK